MKRPDLRQQIPYWLTAVLLLALAAVFLLSRRPVTDANASEPAGRIYVSEAGEKNAASVQAQIREARRKASEEPSVTEPSATEPPTEPPVTEPVTLPTTDAPTAPPATTEQPPETLPPATEPPTEPATEPPTEPPTEPTPSERERQLAELQEQIRTLKIDLFSAEELAAYRRRFDNAVFIGDSLSQAFISYGFFDDGHVKYKRSAAISQLDEQIQAAINRLPETVIFFTGLNDVSYYINDPTKYYEAYMQQIAKVHAALPDAEIYVISLLPPSNDLAKVNQHLARAPEFDEQLKRIDPGSPAHYVDCHWMVRQELYLGDGIHFNEAFYTILIKFLAIETGL